MFKRLFATPAKCLTQVPVRAFGAQPLPHTYRVHCTSETGKNVKLSVNETNVVIEAEAPAEFGSG